MTTLSKEVTRTISIVNMNRLGRNIRVRNNHVVKLHRYRVEAPQNGSS